MPKCCGGLGLRSIDEVCFWCSSKAKNSGKMFKLETGRYHFFKTDTDIFRFFTDIWPAADILLITDTDIPTKYFD